MLLVRLVETESVQVVVEQAQVVRGNRKRLIGDADKHSIVDDTRIGGREHHTTWLSSVTGVVACDGKGRVCYVELTDPSDKLLSARCRTVKLTLGDVELFKRPPMEVLYLPS